jgi:hypothetical protein
MPLRTTRNRKATETSREHPCNQSHSGRGAQSSREEITRVEGYTEADGEGSDEQVARYRAQYLAEFLPRQGDCYELPSG